MKSVRHRPLLALLGAALLAGVLTVAGCSARPPPATVIALQPPSALPVDARWRQRLVATWGDGGIQRFDAVVQKRGDQLLMLVLSPLGHKLVAVQLVGTRVSTRRFVGEPDQYYPRRMLLDFQRVFFPLAGAGADPPPPADGTRRIELPGEVAVETYAGGRIVERRWEPAGDEPRAAVVVEYADWSADGGCPRQVRLHERRVGYELQITTVDYQPL